MTEARNSASDDEVKRAVALTENAPFICRLPKVLDGEFLSRVLRAQPSEFMWIELFYPRPEVVKVLAELKGLRTAAANGTWLRIDQVESPEGAAEQFCATGRFGDDPAWNVRAAFIVDSELVRLQFLLPPFG